MPMFPISEAAKRANVERTTLYRRIKKGEISCQTDESGNKTIEASELLRFYPKANVSEDFDEDRFKSAAHRLLKEIEESSRQYDIDLSTYLNCITDAATEDQQQTTDFKQQITIVLLFNEIKARDEKIRNSEQERERERQNARETIEDLRRRLDQEAEERRRLTLLLTDQRPQAAQKPIHGRFAHAWAILTGKNQSS